MGTPDFAVPSLDILVEHGHEIAAVVTVPDKPAGRGQKLRPSPVKQYAEAKGLPILQPVKLRDPAFVGALEEMAPDLMVVVAFRMLPEMVWSIPKIGTFNLHASLLPDYRGAAPLNWAIINGETQTGATTFFIDKQIDTGNILLKTTLDIPHNWSAGDLHDKLMLQGAALVLETVNGLQAGMLTPKPQDDSLFKHHAPKIHKADCEINWAQDATVVYNFIRGLSPYPTAWTLLGDKIVKIFETEEAGAATGEVGSLEVDTKQGRLWVNCREGKLEIRSLQLQGKKRMTTDDFVRGFKQSLDQFVSSPTP